MHRKVPVGRVGLYVPGGLAPLVSSVLMNVSPPRPPASARSRSRARRSGVRRFGAPDDPRGLRAAGVDEVYAVGGAQAIAMFAHGTGPCAKVDLVTGPGKHLDGDGSGSSWAWSASTPRPVRPRSRSSPTTPADARFVAADLFSQAEHDLLAAAVLVTPSERLADEVEAELDKQVSR